MVDRENLKDSRENERESLFDKKSHFVNKLTLVSLVPKKKGTKKQ